jgi:riboflavin kinase/FMN adenylyltransferase
LPARSCSGSTRHWRAAPEDFINDILLRRLGIAGAAVGFDFRLGRTAPARRISRRRGTKRGFAVDIVPAVEIEGRRISSGVIREALAAGHMAEAN